MCNLPVITLKPNLYMGGKTHFHVKNIFGLNI